MGQAEAGRAGGAHSRGQRQWPDLSACGGTERGARTDGAACWNAPKPRGWTCRSCAVFARMGPTGSGVLTECASVGGTAALRMAYLAEPGAAIWGGGSQAVQGVSKAAAETVRTTVRAEPVKLIRGVIDAQQAEAVEIALQQLLAHPQGKALGQHLNALMERLFVYQMDYCCLQRVSPSGIGATSLVACAIRRNHRSEQRLERAVVVGNLSQLRARSMAIGTPTTLSTSWEECPPSGRACRLDKSVIWMLWASERPRSRRAYGRVSTVSGAGASRAGDRPVMPTNKCPNSPTRAGTESNLCDLEAGRILGAPPTRR